MQSEYIAAMIVQRVEYSLINSSIVGCDQAFTNVCAGGCDPTLHVADQHIHCSIHGERRDDGGIQGACIQQGLGLAEHSNAAIRQAEPFRRDQAPEAFSSNAFLAARMKSVFCAAIRCVSLSAHG